MRRALMVSVLLLGGSAYADEVSCTSSQDCEAIDFCSTEASASCNDSGTCRPRGINVMCMNVSDPVCGCDGKTYDNDCVAHKAGVSVAYVGSCCAQPQ